MRTKSKKFKWSKGEINEKLLERQDLEILESSASYIKNLTSTPYGGVKTRQGTTNIDKVHEGKVDANVPTVTSSIGGTANNLYNETTTFQSDGIESETELFKYDFGGALSLWKLYTENMYFSHTAPEITAVITDGVITGVDITTAGIGINNATVSISDPVGSGAEITLTVDTTGAITGTTIVDGGSNYSSRTTLTVDYDLPTDTLTLQASSDDITYVDLDTYAVTTTSTDYVTTIDSASYRYLKLVSDDAPATKLNLYYCRAYDEATTGANNKLVPFVFSNEQKYLMVLRDESILIYEDDVLINTLTATGLLDSLFLNLKTTQAEDTMIFTHEDLIPKQLQRVGEGNSTFTADAGTDVITLTKYNLYNGLKVQVSNSGGALPAGLSAATDYYVINASGSTCKLSTSLGGSAVNITDAGSGTHTITFQEIFWDFDDFPYELGFYDDFGNKVITNPAVTLTPSAVEGSVKLTASGATFTSASVGQYIDGGGGRVKITEYESTTIVYGYTLIPFYTTSAIGSGAWDYESGYEVVWSATRGYPKTCMFYQQRLWFGGSKSKPSTVWASRVGEYNVFKNIGNYSNDGISATIASEQVDEILNIYANRGVQVFTAGGEWVIPEGSLTPNTITITKNTSNGSLESVYPIDISGTTMFIEKNGKSLLGFVYTDTQASYVTQSMSLLSSLIDAPVAMAVDKNSNVDVGNFVYMVMESGLMAVWCIVLDQQIISPIRFITDGLVTDVVNVTGDTYILVDRKDITYLEKLDEVKTDWTTTDATLSDTITGLDDYNGYCVRVYNDDNNYGLYNVIDGGITLTGIPTEAVYIGIDFDQKLTSTKIAIEGQTENIDKRIAKATVTTLSTDNLTFCNQNATQSNDVYEHYGVTSWDRDCRFTLSSRFDHVEILSVLLNINFGDK